MLYPSYSVSQAILSTKKARYQNLENACKPALIDYLQKHCHTCWSTINVINSQKSEQLGHEFTRCQHPTKSPNPVLRVIYSLPVLPNIAGSKPLKKAGQYFWPKRRQAKVYLAQNRKQECTIRHDRCTRANCQGIGETGVRAAESKHVEFILEKSVQNRYQT